MFLHENERCSVCDKLFTEDDDIVVCHICAAPHHRECYNKLGHCANADRHADGFLYDAVSEVTKDEPEVEDIISQAYEQNKAKNTINDLPHTEKSENASAKTKCSQCGEEVDASAPFCCHCGARQKSPDYSKQPRIDSQFAAQTQFGGNSEELEGRRLRDIADTIKINSNRFINKFKRDKKISWNWAGFIFGPYYLFFRKMYKEGIVTLAISLIAELLVTGIFIEPFTQYNQLLSSYYSQLAGAEATVQNQLMQSFYNDMMPVTQALMPAIAILFAVSIGIRLVTAIFSDRFYRGKVFSVIDKVNKNLADGASFGQIDIIGSEFNMTQEQMKSMYLGKLGGISVFAPLIAYSALNLIISLISKINL